jgi:hypothetical protein
VAESSRRVLWVGWALLLAALALAALRRPAPPVSYRTVGDARGTSSSISRDAPPAV